MSKNQVTINSTARILLDSCMANDTKHPENLFENLESCTALGFRFVALSKDAPYIRAFQQHPEQFEQLVQDKKLIVKRCFSADKAGEKKLNQFLADASFAGTKGFEGLLKGLQNKEEIMALRAMIEKLEDQEEEPSYDSWQERRLVPTEIRNKVWLDAEASRLEVLEACFKAGRMDVFRNYNKFYIKGLAIRYECDFIYRRTGSSERIF